jgi:hypothetical protein
VSKLDAAAVERELGEIADLLDARTTDADALYARRLALWRKAKAGGIASAVLARASRVQPVTVRSILFRNVR